MKKCSPVFQRAKIFFCTCSNHLASRHSWFCPIWQIQRSQNLLLIIIPQNKKNLYHENCLTIILQKNIIYTLIVAIIFILTKLLFILNSENKKKPLAGKVAFVTGSTQGIGLGIAKALVKSGAKLILNGLGEKDNIEKTRTQLEQEYNSEVIYHGADLTDPEQIKNLFEEAHKKQFLPDILVNNAGVQFVSPVDEFPTEKWDNIIAVTLSATFHTTKLAVPNMRKKGYGRIINISSAHGLVASPFKSAYVAAKHGVVGFTKSTALELVKDNITVNAICPGYVRTPLIDKQIPDTAKIRGISEEDVISQIILKAQPIGRFVQKEEIASLVLYLCSPEAAALTGAALSIDGGWTSQ